MLENFQYSLNAVAPVFMIVVIGYLLRRFNFVDDRFASIAERLVFRVTLPVMLFLDVAGARLAGGDSLPMLAYCTVASVASFAVIFAAVPLFVRDNGERGAFIQGCWRSNFAILGIPLAVNMFGSDGELAIALAMPLTIIVFNVLSVIVLSVFAPSDKKESFGATARRITVNILTNPLIISVVVGLPFMIFEWDISAVPSLSKTLTYLDEVTTPLALICLGANFKPEGLRGKVKLSLAAVAVKTVLLPLATVSVAVLLGFRGVALGVIFILFGAPTAVSSYIMAKNMGSDDAVASQVLLFSTLACIFTMFVGIFILKNYALI